MSKDLPERLKRKLDCSENELFDLIPVIRCLLDLSKIATDDCVLRIDDYVMPHLISDKFTLLILRFAIDGSGAQVIEDIAFNLIISGNYSGKELIEKLIITETSLNLANETTYHDCETSIYSYFSKLNYIDKIVEVLC